MRSTTPILISLALAAAAVPVSAEAAATFAAPTSTTVSDKPEAIALADFNGDGTLDAVVGNRDDQAVDVLFGGSGGLTKAPGSPFSVGHNLPAAVAAADLNGDGRADIVSAAAVGSDNGKVAVLLGDGAGHFAAAAGSPYKTHTDGPNSQGGLTLADMDGDGDLDVIVAGGDEVAILKNPGTGVLAEGVPTQVGFSDADTIAVGNFVGDALPDVVSTSGEPYTSNLLLNTAGTLSFHSVFTDTGQDVAAAQLNGSGRDDLLFTRTGSGKALSFLSDADASWAKHGGDIATDALFSNAVRLGDIDADGVLDAAIAADDVLPVLKGDGAGGFAAFAGSPLAAPNYHLGVAIGDVTGDAQPDVVYTTQDDDAVLVARNEQTAAATGTSAVDFGTKSDGDTADATVTLTSSGPGFYRVSSAVPVGAGIAKTSDTCTGVALAVGRSCTVGLRFTAGTTPVSGALNVADNAGGRAIPLTGTGTAKQVTPVPVPVPGPVRDTTKPVLKHLKASRSSVSLRLSEAGSVVVKIEKKLSGRKKGKKCVAPSRKLRKARSCTRYVKVKTLSRKVAVGTTKLSYKKLGKGSYRFTAVPKDSAGNVGATVKATLKVKR